MSIKYNLVIFDADIIIYLVKIRKLDSLFKICKIYLTGQIYNEIKFYTDSETNQKKVINLDKYIDNKQLMIKEVLVKDMLESENRSKIDYFNSNHYEVHNGELEGIYFVLKNTKYKFCTGDAGAYRLMGYLGIKKNAISLEEILGKLRNMEQQYKSKFMKECLKQGSTLMIEDM